MGPKVCGDQSKVGYVYTDADLYPGDDDIVIDMSKMTADEILFARYGNGRRAQIRRIDDAMRRKDSERSSNTSVSTDHAPHPTTEINSKGNSSMNEGIVGEDEPEPPRFLEIREYLVNNWNQLALGTLHFFIVEHILFEYINRNGGIRIAASEFRRFL